MALRTASIDPATFTSIRFLAGALTLCLILLAGSKPLKLRGHWVSALVLNAYAVGYFHFSYINLTAGTGAAAVVRRPPDHHDRRRISRRGTHPIK